MLKAANAEKSLKSESNFIGFNSNFEGNCDIQIMIYESDPDNFDLRDISKVTDYVVAYSCKRNATLWEEIENNQ